MGARGRLRECGPRGLDHAGTTEAKHRLQFRARKAERLMRCPTLVAKPTCVTSGPGPPGQIAGRQIAIDEAMQEPLNRLLEPLEFASTPTRKALVAAESETFRDLLIARHPRRARSAPQDRELRCGIGFRSVRLRKSRPILDAGTGSLCLLRKPAQQARGIGGQEKASGGEQIDVSETRGNRANPMNDVASTGAVRRSPRPPP